MSPFSSYPLLVDIEVYADRHEELLELQAELNAEQETEQPDENNEVGA